jgi:chaperonin cofactor prefoldin
VVGICKKIRERPEGINIADNKLQELLSNFSGVAKQRYKIAMYGHKIKSYKNEMNLIFRKVGILVFENKLTDDKEVIKLFASIEHYKNKIIQIDKQLNDIKSLEYRKEENQNSVTFEKADYKKPTMDGSDLIMARTSEGIKLVRFCPHCDYANDSSLAVCENCGQKISD